MTIPPPAPVPRTVAELLARLGNIPADRVRLQPSPGTAREADLLAAGADAARCELVDGTLVEKAVGSPAAFLAAILIGLLDRYLERHNLGVHFAPDAMFRMSDGNTRMPDVSFVAWDRLPPEGLPDDPITAVAPDFAVEILSPSNTPAEIDRKVRELFASGTRLAWVIDPEAESGEILTGPDAIQPIPAGGTLTGDPVLPGFAVALPALFARTRRPGS